MPLISFDILKIYQDCKGDMDMFARTATKRENLLFGDQEGTVWRFIDSAMQNIELISRKLASSEFTAQVLSGLKENCDEKSFIELTSRISFYEGFQEVAHLVAIIKDKMAIDTDFVYTRFESLPELEMHIDICIEGLKLCDFEKLGKVHLDFGPTGTYQELSMRNGWADEYLKIAEEFDRIYAAIYANIPPPDFKATQPRSGTPNILIKLWSRVFAKVRNINEKKANHY